MQINAIYLVSALFVAVAHNASRSHRSINLVLERYSHSTSCGVFLGLLVEHCRYEEASHMVLARHVCVPKWLWFRPFEAADLRRIDRGLA